MANGDMLAADYEFQLHNTLYGRENNGVSIQYGEQVEGVDVPEPKTQDVPFSHSAGVYANPDYADIRVITIPAICRNGSAATVMANYKLLVAAWAPVTADTDLGIQLPGMKFYVLGRPRGAKADLSQMNLGVVRVLLRFDCPDPTLNFI